MLELPVARVPMYSLHLTLSRSSSQHQYHSTWLQVTAFCCLSVLIVLNIPDRLLTAKPSCFYLSLRRSFSFRHLFSLPPERISPTHLLARLLARSYVFCGILTHTSVNNKSDSVRVSASSGALRRRTGTDVSHSVRWCSEGKGLDLGCISATLSDQVVVGHFRRACLSS